MSSLLPNFNLNNIDRQSPAEVMINAASIITRMADLLDKIYEETDDFDLNTSCDRELKNAYKEKVKNIEKMIKDFKKVSRNRGP